LTAHAFVFHFNTFPCLLQWSIVDPENAPEKVDVFIKRAADKKTVATIATQVPSSAGEVTGFLESLPDDLYFIYVGNANRNAHGYSANFPITPGGERPFVVKESKSRSKAPLLTSHVHFYGSLMIGVVVYLLE
jgi:hypothetical protein